MTVARVAIDPEPASGIEPGAELAAGPRGPKPRRVSPGRFGLYAFLIVSAIFFLVPLYIMIVTSLKGMPEIRLGHLFSLPAEPTVQPWIDAAFKACTGRDCYGLSPGFLNSVKITVPSVIISIICASATERSLILRRGSTGVSHPSRSNSSSARRLISPRLRNSPPA